MTADPGDAETAVQWLCAEGLTRSEAEEAIALGSYEEAMNLITAGGYDAVSDALAAGTYTDKIGDLTSVGVAGEKEHRR
jgi:hypothetical protein